MIAGMIGTLAQMFEHRANAHPSQTAREVIDALTPGVARDVARAVTAPQPRRQIPQWTAARLGDADPPVFAIIDEKPGRQRRDEPCSHERRLAAAGAPDDSQESVLPELGQHIPDLRPTAEEKVALVGLKGTEPDKRVRRLLHGGPPP